MKNKNKKEKNKRNKQAKDILKTNLEVLMIRSYDEGINAFVLSSGKYLDLVEIVAKDRENLQEDAINYDVFMLTKFERMFSPDHKDIGLNFPINTSRQRSYLELKLKKTQDPVRKLWLEREINELLSLESEIERKEFYRMYFAETKDELEKNRRNILNWLGRGQSKIVREINKEKKIQIVRKLANMNTLILPDDLIEEDNDGI